jgi:tetratricopeptide (TPR) repeat protein
MARIDKRRARSARANARVVKPAPKRGGGSAIEDTMFFPRLRRHTKWMFVLLALVFGLGFVIFGVGASGTGLGDLFRNNSASGGQVSVKKALKETQQRPKDPKAWHDLSTAYQTEGDTEAAIGAQARYTQLAPRNADGLRELASLYLTQAQQRANDAQLAQLRSAFAGTTPTSSGFTVGTQPVFTDPLATTIAASSNAELSAAQQAQSTALAQVVSVYQKLAALTPNDPSAQLNLAQNALQAGNTTVAVAAFRRFLKLAPEDPTAPIVRKQLKQLTQAITPAPKTPSKKPNAG